LTKVAETIIVEDSGASLCQRIAELEAENSRLKDATVESVETIGTLQRTVDNGVNDYNLLLEGNKSLLVERNDFRYRCEDLKAKLAEAHSDAQKKVADLEARVRVVEAHSVDVAATDEKRLKDFEGELIQDLAELRTLYVRNAQTIRGLCSSMPEGEPSAVDYLHWLSTKISSLPDMFGGVNENFITTVVVGALIMARDFVNIDALQSASAESGADILPTECGVLRAARAVSKKWWRSFGYDYVLAAIRATHEKVLVCM
jgi:hypothetical protein